MALVHDFICIQWSRDLSYEDSSTWPLSGFTHPKKNYHLKKLST